MAKSKRMTPTAAPVEDAVVVVTNDGVGPVEVLADSAMDTTVASPIPRTRGPRGVAENAVITMISETNPKRPNSKASTAFACYVDGMTIAEFCDSVDALGDMYKGTATGHLVYDTKHGFISIAGYTPPGGLVPAKALRVAKPKAEKKIKAVKAPAESYDAEAVTSLMEEATTEESME